MLYQLENAKGPSHRLGTRSSTWGKCSLTDTESGRHPMCWASAPTLPLCWCHRPHKNGTSSAAVLVSLSSAGVRLGWAHWVPEGLSNLSVSRALFQECRSHTHPLHGQLSLGVTFHVPLMWGGRVGGGPNLVSAVSRAIAWHPGLTSAAAPRHMLSQW